MAQQVQPQPIDRSNNERRRQQEMSNREYQLRNLGVAGRGAANDKEKKALMEQVEQDFSRILLLHNQIARSLSSDAVLDYRFVADAAAEIKKRSTRLQSTLALHELDAEKDGSKTPDVDHHQMKPALTTLCKFIRSFVTNPVIEKPGTVDVEHLGTARRDLANIITLSGVIRKQADKHGN